MTVTSGPNLNLMVNAELGESFYTQFVAFLRGIDGLVQARVLDKDLATPPTTIVDGAMYIVAASPTGAWGGRANQLARGYTVGVGAPAWEFYTPRNGWSVAVLDEPDASNQPSRYSFNGTTWAKQASGGSGGSFSGGKITTALDEPDNLTIASAATLALDSQPANTLIVTGTTSVSSFSGGTTGSRRLFFFQSVLTLVNGANTLVLASGANITTQAGDIAEFVKLASGAWKLVGYLRADGTALIGSGSGGSFTGGTLTSAINEAPLRSHDTGASGGNVIGQSSVDNANTIRVLGSSVVSGMAAAPAGATRTLLFTASIDQPLTHNATSFILLTAGNLFARDGDVAEFLSLGSGNWRMTGYTRANGTALVGSGAGGGEPVIAPGTTAQYWRGDKTWQNFGADVLATTLAGLVTTSNAVVTAADTVLIAAGKFQAQINNKVSTVTGMGLSSNDFTSAEKTKLGGIAAGATANQTDTYLVNRANHTGSQAIGTVTGLQAALDTKVDKVTGMGLSSNDFTSAEKTKLAGLDGNHFRGTFTSLAALNSGVTGAVAGDYADVDAGVGSDVQRYIYDVNDAKWVAQGGASASLTAAQVKTLYESNPDTNAYTNAEKTKLGGIAAGAQVNTVTSVAGRTGAVTLAKADVGLGAVDNTSDVSKPVSTAQQSALDAKEPTIAAGTAAQYWNGAKGWSDFATGVRSALMTGLSLVSSAAVVAADTLVVAVGKLQAQINAINTSLTGKAASGSNNDITALQQRVAATSLSVAQSIDKTQVLTSATGTVNLDLSLYGVFDLTLTGATTVVFTNRPTLSGESIFPVIRVRQGATSFLFTHPAGTTWLTAGGAMPPQVAATKMCEYAYRLQNTDAPVGSKGPGN